MIEKPKVGQVVWVRGYNPGHGPRVPYEPATVVQSVADNDGDFVVRIADFPDRKLFRAELYAEEEALALCLLQAAGHEVGGGR